MKIFLKFPTLVFSSFMLISALFSTVLQAQKTTTHLSVSLNSARFLSTFTNQEEAEQWFLFSMDNELRMGLSVAYGFKFEGYHSLFTPYLDANYSLHRFYLKEGLNDDLSLHFFGVEFGTFIKIDKASSFSIGLDNSFRVARNNLTDQYPFRFWEEDIDERFRIWNPGLDLGYKLRLFQTRSENDIFVGGSYILPVRKIFDDKGYTLNVRRFQIGIFVDLR